MADFLQQWGGHLASAATLLWAIYLFVRGARKEELDAVRTDIVAVRAELKEHKDDGSASRQALSERVGHIETVLGQMPDKDTVHRLEVSVTEIRGDIKAQGETLSAVKATTNRVEDFLLNRGGKA